MILPSLTTLARNQARFVKYENGCLWYQILWSEATQSHVTLGGMVYETRHMPRIFDFPIDVRGDDAGGTFGSSERGVTFMRWIRKHLEMLAAAQEQPT